MKAAVSILVAGLLTVAFTLALKLDSSADEWSRRDNAGNFLGLMFGDGRKLMASQFFTMADVYFHSGYYPSVFDQKRGGEKEIISASHGKKEDEEDEKNEDFLGKPKDWVDAFGRNFKIAEHTHLEHGDEREILPWLRLAANLDPQKIETYTVGAFFLREHLHRVDQAEAFLREGLRNNPGNPELLFELGRLYKETSNDVDHARNVWLLAKSKIHDVKRDMESADRVVFEEITVNLARLEADAGNYSRAIGYFQEAQAISFNPGALQEQIDALQKKLNALIPLTPQKLF
jgi:tetratricopeptide (TPR) repeat protein